jgi:hypothetical protein
MALLFSFLSVLAIMQSTRQLFLPIGPEKVAAPKKAN